jgi:response regulator RpfG family c-di-GMP phosphodiesterase
MQVALTQPGLFVADATVPWVLSFLETLPEEDAPAVLVVAEGGSVGVVPSLIRAGADAFLALPASRLVAAAAVESALHNRRRRAASDSALSSALRRLHYLEDIGADLARERHRGDSLASSLVRLEESFLETCRSLATAVDSRGQTTPRPIERVTALAESLARLVAPELAAEPHLTMGFLLHDLGEIRLPDTVLTKQGHLSPEERELMRQHAAFGADLVQHIDLLRPVVPIVRHHHERWDGRGYPDGLAGEAIPHGARIFAVVDAADAMLHDRPYRDALDIGAACLELELGAGTQFDPDVVAAFLALAESGGVELGVAV